jgi:hypothetical protein
MHGAPRRMGMSMGMSDLDERFVIWMSDER